MLRALACLLVFAIAAGCGGKDPVRPDTSTPPRTYSARSEPESTVMDYALAWEKRDSSEIEIVLADDYEGTSTLVGPVTETLTFTKSDEVRAVHGLKDDADVTAVSVLLSPPSSWAFDRRPNDPPEWVTITPNSVYILIQRSGGADLVSNTSCTFTLKPLASGSDTTWSIVRWIEVHQSQ